MAYGEYRGPEIEDEEGSPSSFLGRIGSIAARVINVIVMGFFLLGFLGSWLNWRESGEMDDYSGIFVFAVMSVLALPPLGTLLRRRLGPRAARWIRWGGCFLIYLLWGASMVV